MAAKTVEAYSRDVEQFLTFLTMHLAGPPGIAELREMRIADLRQAVVDTTVGEFGRLDVVHLNAGVGGATIALTTPCRSQGRKE